MKKSSSATRRTAKPSRNRKANSVGDVRIIGGHLKRRSVGFIDAEGLRPTPDRLRETLFNWLLADLHDALVLDTCAGSGVLGFEALSRGARHCTFIEASAAQSQQLQQSADLLRLNDTQYRIVCGTAQDVIAQDAPLNQPFDVVFIDPPYAHDLWQPILTALLSRQLLSTATLIYLEADKDLHEQLTAWTEHCRDMLSDQGFNDLTCLKQTKVGQVVAGLYCLSSS